MRIHQRTKYHPPPHHRSLIEAIFPTEGSSMRLHRSQILSLVFLSLGLPTESLIAEDYQPQIAGPSKAGQLAIQGFKVPEGMQGKLIAAEPNLANPVAFCIDAQGRFYICETFRQKKGVEDNRSHMNWLHDDLAAQTVEDRLAFFRKHLKDKVNDYGKEHDRIRRLTDTDGDGLIDQSTVFADGFNNILDGTGAGVLVDRGKVYYTCIPDLWLLKDEDNDGRADTKKSLAHGFGVRVAFRGHDMHGLTIGPDGRLYFSIGDRGLNVTTKEGRQLVYPDTGAVLRCERDGSHLEVFATGLRNPQELAFDDHGNLFTGDNNSDSGDKARWVYVVKGSDSGWRMYYQYLNDRGPWNRERIWYPYKSDAQTTVIQPAYIVPPIANIADGPSGLTYYPGVGLSDRYNGHFFLCDFRGNAGNSGIRSFAVKPKGAGFELVDSHQFIWSILATDADFGYDGSLYITDWVEGWDGPGKGRLYSFADPTGKQAAEAANVAKLMQEGFDHLKPNELTELLSHADKRIRQEAQFALVRNNAIDELKEIATQSDKSLPRRHAIWALGQLIRQGEHQLIGTLNDLLSQEKLDPETHAQVLRVLGDNLPTNAHSKKLIRTQTLDCVVQRLGDKSPRVQFFAAMTLANIGGPESLPALLTLLDANQNRDPLIRHAAVMGLVGIGNRHSNELLKHNTHPSRYGRLGILLALRRLRSPEIVHFLNDAEPQLVLEAARAINDVPIGSIDLSQLASLAKRPGLSNPLLRRVIHANFRMGTREAANNLAMLAADSRLSEPLRLEALGTLTEWDNPLPLDRVTGRWRPLKPHSTKFLAAAIRPKLGGLFTGSDKIRTASAKLAAKYGIQEVVPVLVKIVADAERDETSRVAALTALDQLKSDKLSQVIDDSLISNLPTLRAEARKLLAKRNPKKAIGVLYAAIESGETIECQSALDVLASMKDPRADTVISTLMERLVKGQVTTEVQLDILEAAQERNTPRLKKLLKAYEASLPKENPFAAYRVALAGGNPQRGEEIFFGRSEVSCRRCHKINGSGGEVGPDLSDISLKKKRDYLLESLVDPNKQIAKGFESVLVATADGQVIHGVFKSEDDTTLRLMNKDGGIIRISKKEIEDRAVGKSGMPSDLIKHLTKSDVRDLVEYLSTLKTPPQKAKSEHKE